MSFLLVNRMVTTEDICVHFKQNSETPIHAIWTCPCLVEIWRKDNQWKFCNFQSFNSTLELLHFVIDRGKAIEPLAILLWTFWPCTNSQNILSDQVSQFANDQLLEFEIVNSTCPSFPLDQSPLCRPRVHWISPSAGTVKINFNGASFKDADCAGIGGIICDEWGLRDCCTFPNILLCLIQWLTLRPWLELEL